MRKCCITSIFISACVLLTIISANQLWYIELVRGVVVEKESVGQDNVEYVVKVLVSETTGATRNLTIKNQWYMLKFNKDEVYNSIRVNGNYKFYIMGKDNNIRFCE